MKQIYLKYCMLLLIFVSASAYAKSEQVVKTGQKIGKRLQNWQNPLTEWENVGKIKIDSMSVLPEKKTIQLFFSTPLSYIAVREENCRLLEQSLKEALGRKYQAWSLEIRTDHHLLQELIPNAFRNTLARDESRIPGTGQEPRIPLVRKADSEIPGSGLYNNHIALWSSHGWYYESKLDRWEWQRPRLFGTAEDIFTKSIALPFLVPMLENSGATVLLPVERDWQPHEVIADNDFSTGKAQLLIPEGAVYQTVNPGFLWKDTLVSGENPFQMGTSLRFEAIPGTEKSVTALPAVAGEYGVCISWQSDENSSQEVQVTVIASGEKHRFLVNQRIGGGTWIYLGTFTFSGTVDPDSGPESVAVSLNGNLGEVISVDAIRLGGGMGNVARRPAMLLRENVKSADDATAKRVESITDPALFTLKTSGKSRYREGARYYLQYAGFPDSLVYNLNEGKNDYNDDYMSRGEWVNYLMGKPNGPEKDRNVRGLQIPVDLAFAFHTDAGITPGDSIIGTLAIYSTWADKGKFPDGTSRMASRDLADLIQTQIVRDLRAQFNPEWTRRGLWDKQYSESWRPNVPVMLLEMLSHQNLADMRFGQDPRFQFAVARAIYKGMLKFQASRESRPFVVQPLPVDHFALTLLGDSAVKLCWQPVADPLEPTALPSRFRVYTRENGKDFDAGRTVSDTCMVVRLAKMNADYSFRVTALNDGGESFPSETLSVGLAGQSKGTVLLVSAFDRICGPAFFDTGNIGGREEWNDQGVPYRFNTGYTGQQYDFNRKSEWSDDDNPGWGSSYGDMENLRIPGNNFDFAAVHGKAVRVAGYSYVSVSDEVFCRAGFDVSPYAAVDVILGEEKGTPGARSMEQGARSEMDGEKGMEFRIYTPEFMKKLREVASTGGNLLLSGAYVGSDFAECNDTLAARFAREILHFVRRTGHAVHTGHFYSTDYGRKWFSLTGDFNTSCDPVLYPVEAPDGIEPADKSAFTAFRYGENNISAAVAYRGNYRSVVLGFPLETITGPGTLDQLVQQVMRFFEEK